MGRADVGIASGIVDQHVDPVGQRGEGRLDLRGVTRVEGDRAHFRAEFRGGLLEHVLAPSSDHCLVAVFREGLATARPIPVLAPVTTICCISLLVSPEYLADKVYAGPP